MTTQLQEQQSILNSINFDSAFTQPDTTAENIQEYFNSYIKTFFAFKDEPVYKAVISFLIKYYVDIVYNKQPELFKDLFEKQTINRNLIDLLLISIGLPENLVRELTTTSKFVIMKSFSDFMRYKGTIKFIRSIGGAFSDVMSYYELYIDYDPSYINPRGKFLVTIDKSLIPNGSYFIISSIQKKYYVWFNLNGTASDPFKNNNDGMIGIEIQLTDNITSNEIADQIINHLNLTGEFFVNVNSTDVIEIELSEHGEPLTPPLAMTTNLVFKIITEGKDDGAWILRPRPIYIHPKMDRVEEVFTYQEAYQKIPSLLLSENQLTELKNNNNIVLPTKSNIILMDYTSSIDGNYLNTLFFTILMEYIGDDLFPVFFTGSDGTTTITYNTAFLLWYYLVAKYFNVTLEGVDLAYYNVMGTKKITEYTIFDIPIIEEEYNKIQTREELYQFYLTRIEDQFNRKYAAKKPTIPAMAETLRRLDSKLFEYVEDRLATAENIEQDIRYLLDEIYASIVLSFDRYKENEIVSKYIPIILDFLTQITTSIKMTDSYKIVYNLKPFHTEILDLARNKIIINDKFNSLLFDDEDIYLFYLILADILHMSDQTIFRFIPKNDCSSIMMMDSAELIFNTYVESIYEILNHLIFYFHYPTKTFYNQNFTDRGIPIYRKNGINHSYLALLSHSDTQHTFKQQTNISLTDNFLIR